MFLLVLKKRVLTVAPVDVCLVRSFVCVCLFICYLPSATLAWLVKGNNNRALILLRQSQQQMPLGWFVDTFLVCFWLGKGNWQNKIKNKSLTPTQVKRSQLLTQWRRRQCGRRRRRFIFSSMATALSLFFLFRPQPMRSSRS